MGMTDEFDIGLFMKRARSVQALFGDYRYHANRFAALAFVFSGLASRWICNLICSRFLILLSDEMTSIIMFCCSILFP